MRTATRTQGLRIALVIFGGTCFLIYPLALLWPTGWIWHGDHGMHYFQIICSIYAVLGWFLIRAARAPEHQKSLIKFTIMSSIIHAGIMLMQVRSDHSEIGHLIGDIPALIIVAAVLWTLSSKETTT